MKYHRTRTRAELLLVKCEGETFAIRRDLLHPSLLHLKHTWPSGRRYWRPMTPFEWSHLPEQVRDAVRARWGFAVSP